MHKDLKEAINDGKGDRVVDIVVKGIPRESVLYFWQDVSQPFGLKDAILAKSPLFHAMASKGMLSKVLLAIEGNKASILAREGVTDQDLVSALNSFTNNDGEKRVTPAHLAAKYDPEALWLLHSFGAVVDSEAYEALKKKVGSAGLNFFPQSPLEFAFETKVFRGFLDAIVKSQNGQKILELATKDLKAYRLLKHLFSDFVPICQTNAANDHARDMFVSMFKSHAVDILAADNKKEVLGLLNIVFKVLMDKDDGQRFYSLFQDKEGESLEDIFGNIHRKVALRMLDRSLHNANLDLLVDLSILSSKSGLVKDFAAKIESLVPQEGSNAVVQDDLVVADAQTVEERSGEKTSVALSANVPNVQSLAPKILKYIQKNKSAENCKGYIKSQVGVDAAPLLVFVSIFRYEGDYFQQLIDYFAGKEGIEKGLLGKGEFMAKFVGGLQKDDLAATAVSGDYRGCDAYTIACYNGELNIVKQLLQKICELKVYNHAKFLNSVVNPVMQSNSDLITEYVLKEQSFVNKNDAFWAEVLFGAIKFCNTKAVELYLESPDAKVVTSLKISQFGKNTGSVLNIGLGYIVKNLNKISDVSKKSGHDNEKLKMSGTLKCIEMLLDADMLYFATGDDNDRLVLSKTLKHISKLGECSNQDVKALIGKLVQKYGHLAESNQKLSKILSEGFEDDGCSTIALSDATGFSHVDHGENGWDNDDLEDGLMNQGHEKVLGDVTNTFE